MAKIKTLIKLMLEMLWIRINSPPLLVEMQIVQALWKSMCCFLRKLGINLPQNPTKPLMGIYSKDGHSHHKDIWSTMSIAALFIIARTWKQPKMYFKKCGTFTQCSTTQWEKITMTL